MKSYAMSSSEIVSKQNLKKFDIRRVDRRRLKVESNDIGKYLGRGNKLFGEKSFFVVNALKRFAGLTNVSAIVV